MAIYANLSSITLIKHLHIMYRTIRTHELDLRIAPENNNYLYRYNNKKTNPINSGNKCIASLC